MRETLISLLGDTLGPRWMQQIDLAVICPIQNATGSKPAVEMNLNADTQREAQPHSVLRTPGPSLLSLRVSQRHCAEAQEPRCSGCASIIAGF
jgi:hypothetical protein